MNRAIWPLAGFALLVLVLGVGLYATRDRNNSNMVIVTSPLLGKPAPQYKLPDLLNQGETVSTDLHTGSWRLVNVWGTWCSECRAEHSTLLAIKQTGLVKIIGIDWKDDDNDARNWLQQLGDPYDAVAADRVGNVAVDWGVYAAPENFLVDPNGIVCVKQTGGMTMRIWQEQFVPQISKPACELPS